MKTKTSLFLAAGFTSLSALSVNAQIAINKSFSNPNASAILDLNTGNAGVNKGFLAPQVALTNVTVAAPVTSPATGLIVYSTTSPFGGNGKGYYFWNGTAWSGMDATINGMGTADYIARWTNATTLGTGLIQDNGTGVGVNSAPTTDMFNVSTASGAAIYGLSSDPNAVGIEGYDASTGAVGIFGKGYAGGSFLDLVSDGCTLASNGLGIYALGQNVAGYFQDANGDYAYIADNVEGDGIFAYGLKDGGYFSDPIGDNTYIDDNANGLGINAYGTVDGGYFSNAAGCHGWSAEGGTSIRGCEYWDYAGDWGVIGDVTNLTGGYFQDAGGDYAYVAYNGYGILSNGVKSTEVKDEKNQERVLFCDESPEIVFHDYGTAQLTNGKVHVSLDPLYAKNVAINEKHPLRVMVTLNDECNGVFVKNRTATGFDVVELNHGSSNASFTYEVIANRADTKNAKGETYNYSDWRFPIAPGGPLTPGKPVAQKAPVKQAPVKPVFKAQSPNRGN